MKKLIHISLAALSLAGVSAAEKPNILWITSEDNSISWVSCYGNANARTPAIDQLAKEGFLYSYCFDNAAVCSPTRSTWITGMYAISNGTQPMRSRNVIPHDRIPYYPDLLGKAGYHTSNPGKTDYNIGGRDDTDCWDYGARTDEEFGWRKRKEGQPFFCVMNYKESHETRAQGPVNNTKTDPAKMRLAAYHPDLPAIRQNYAKYADAVERMDKQVARCIKTLKEDGLYEDTIIIYNSDHGGVMPRSKRFLYSSGIHCPLIIRIPEKWKALWPAEKPGMTVERMVSFVDMPKTWLSLAGAEIPDTFQGTIFLGKDTEPEPEYHLSFRERADERLDSVRMIRDKRFAYHRNYMPYVPEGQYLPFLWRQEATRAWEKHHLEGKTDEITGHFFRPRLSEEFYDNAEDFDNVHNLIDRKEHQEKIARMRAEMRKRQLELFDSGLLPEKMRERRAAAHGMTIYDMVRDKKLYPLEDYLDAADLALARDPGNLDRFVKGMSDKDDGMRWWAVVGLLLLDEKAAPAEQTLLAALQDETHEIRMMAAWTLIKLGKPDQAMACLDDLLFNGTQNEWMLHNVLDWMGESAFPLVKKYVENGGERKSQWGAGILGRIAEQHGW